VCEIAVTESGSLSLAHRACDLEMPVPRRLPVFELQAVEVIEVLPGSAADKAGIRPCDWIVAAAGLSAPR
jgi:C-terminal processing protease CtpA/Prc